MTKTIYAPLTFSGKTVAIVHQMDYGPTLFPRLSGEVGPPSDSEIPVAVIQATIRCCVVERLVSLRGPVIQDYELANPEFEPWFLVRVHLLFQPPATAYFLIVNDRWEYYPISFAEDHGSTIVRVKNTRISQVLESDSPLLILSEIDRQVIAGAMESFLHQYHE